MSTTKYILNAEYNVRVEKRHEKVRPLKTARRHFAEASKALKKEIRKIVTLRTNRYGSFAKIRHFARADAESARKLFDRALAR